MLEEFRNKFWNEDIWTPPNTTWAVYEEKGYRHFNDIYLSAYTAILIVGIRIFLNRFIYIPLGIWMGLPPSRPRPPPTNSMLEKAYRETRGNLNKNQITALCKQLDCNERKIQRWMRLRRIQDRPTILSKFTESAWRCSFYALMFIYGFIILWDKPWMWDSIHCLIDYPHHYVSSEEWWYYHIESAFYLSLLFSQFVDVQRKDFWVMFVHHVVTLCLLSFSWACNLVRMGTLVLFIHDFADIPLEGAKMMFYLKKQKIADWVFNVFAICWITSRICLLPYRIIYYSLFKAPQLIPMFAAYYIFNFLLVALQTLHIIWTYFIVVMCIQAWNNNGIRDIRSDDEDDGVEEELNDDEDEDLTFGENRSTATKNDSETIPSNGNTHSRQLFNENRTKTLVNGLNSH